MQDSTKFYSLHIISANFVKRTYDEQERACHNPKRSVGSIQVLIDLRNYLEGDKKKIATQN